MMLNGSGTRYRAHPLASAIHDVAVQEFVGTLLASASAHGPILE
jgi:hypothetical protein